MAIRRAGAFRAAVMKYLAEPLNGSGPTRLDALARKLVDDAHEGDLNAIKEVAAIVDGRAENMPEDAAAADRVSSIVRAAAARAAEAYAGPVLVEEDETEAPQEDPAALDTKRANER